MNKKPKYVLEQRKRRRAELRGDSCVLVEKTVLMQQGDPISPGRGGTREFLLSDKGAPNRRRVAASP